MKKSQDYDPGKELLRKLKERNSKVNQGRKPLLTLKEERDEYEKRYNDLCKKRSNGEEVPIQLISYYMLILNVFDARIHKPVGFTVAVNGIEYEY